MDIEFVAKDVDPSRGGYPSRNASLLRILSQIGRVRAVLTSWPEHPDVPGVEFRFEPPKRSRFHRASELWNYFSTSPPKAPISDAPDVRFVESLDLLGYAKGTKVPLILDEHNVYWNLLRYDMVNTPFFQSRFGRWTVTRAALVPWLLRRAKRFEIRALRRSTGVLATSDADRREILTELPELSSKLFVLPNCVDATEIPVSSEEAQPPQVLFAGNFNYVPNLEAAHLITNVIAPQIPEAQFLLVGINPPVRTNGPANVRVIGYVKNLEPFLRESTVCIAPLLRGSGTRIKLLTYLAAGKAVVATSKACEGLEVQDGHHLLVREGWPEFVRALRDVLSDPAARHRLGREGRKLVETTYDWRVHVETMKQVLRRVGVN